ncbi:hypothetical protein F9K92_15730 [Stenotrophomonas rhizophila]|uniref:Uncharacterized protein n=1 Tax=Stenotrophomonas rhizophila TaxID=216778 RepID=A0A7V8CBY9_9GAMM|nr:hypothetical protein F9K92_15730 [Stenotrophomonas rhizophila]
MAAGFMHLIQAGFELVVKPSVQNQISVPSGSDEKRATIRAQHEDVATAVHAELAKLNAPCAGSKPPVRQRNV